MPKKPDTEHQPQLLPPTKVVVMFRPHATQEHVDGLEQHLQSATLFVPEMNISTAESIQVLERVSAGEQHPVMAVAMLGVADTMRGHLLGVLQVLHNSQVKVALADITAEDSLNIALEASEHQNIYAAELEQTLQNLLENLQNYHQLQSEREDRIVENLLQQLQANPQEQTIVMTLGSMHAPIVEKLRQQAGQFAELTVEVDADNSPESSYQHQVLKQIANGEKVPQESLLRTLLEKLITDSAIRGQLDQAFTDPIEAERWIKDAVAQFTVDEIRDLYSTSVTSYTAKEQAGEMIVVGKFFSMLSMVVGDALTQSGGLFEQKGIAIPKPSIDEDEMYDPYV